MSLKEDQERLAELRLKVFGKVAKNLLNGAEDPYWLSNDTIEKHAGRIDKALRVLREGGYIGRTHTEEGKTHYGSRIFTHYQEITKFDEESAQYGYPDAKDTFYRDLSSLYGDAYESVPEYAGFKAVQTLPSDSAIHIWHNRGEYRLIPEAGVYPLVYERIRNINVLRCIVERRLALTYKERFQNKMSLNGQLPEKHERRIDHRNIGYSPSLLSDAGLLDYENEYLHWERYFKALRQNLIAFRDSISSKGGPAEVIKQMRLECMTEQLHEAPLIATRKDNPDRPTAKFLLQNTELFDYDTIYGKDATVTHIEVSDHRWSRVAEGISEPFVPEAEDAAIAAQAKE